MSSGLFKSVTNKLDAYKSYVCMYVCMCVCVCVCVCVCMWTGLGIISSIRVDMPQNVTNKHCNKRENPATNVYKHKFDFLTKNFYK